MKHTPAKWLDKGLFHAPHYYTLVTTEKQLHQEMRRLNVPRDRWPYFDKKGVTASMVELENEDGKRCAIVIIPPAKQHDPIDTAASIVHEAMHLWRAIREHIGETSPSCEFEAYAMQNITEQLFREYARQTGRAS